MRLANKGSQKRPAARQIITLDATLSLPCTLVNSIKGTPPV